MTANAATRLLQHYVDNFRPLPWRSPPGRPPPDPYRVWLSEVMLQQTTVAAVIPRFGRFVARWPTVEALAAAPEAEVLSEWAGLGYYARARNLIACAREVATLGAFPKTSSELERLPGIGRYTAAAVAAIAFGEARAAVDTNVLRVGARLSGARRPDPDAVEALVTAMIPPGRAGDLAQALMDLGATICRPKVPNCMVCPLRDDCAALATGSPEAFPERAERRIRPSKTGVAWWIVRDGHVWLMRRPAKGLLGGMAALPGSEWTEGRAAAPAAALGTVRHVFTHFTLDLHMLGATEAVGSGWWHPIDKLTEAGLPTLYRRAADVALTATASDVPTARRAA